MQELQSTVFPDASRRRDVSSLEQKFMLCVAAVVMINSVTVEMLHTSATRVLPRWPDAYRSSKPAPEGSRFPPPERFRQETFQRRQALKSLGTRAFCHLARPRQANEGGAQKTGHIRRSFMDDMKGTWIRSEPR
jgi:hypothetical protein